MDYSTFQIILLLNDEYSINRNRVVVKKIRHFIENFTKQIIIKYEDTRKLAYEINSHQTAFFVAIQLNMKTIGANKRIKLIEEKINTYEEIIKYKVIEKDKIINEIEENKVYIVYEFDYGDISNGSKPRVTHFGCYSSIENAQKKANELLKEGLEQYFIENSLKEEKNPFEKYSEIHLYNEEDEDKQNISVYYIKIEKLNLE